MSASNSVNIIGSVTRDVTVSTVDGQEVAEIALAVNDPWQRVPVLYVMVKAYGEWAKSAAERLAKGARVAVNGELFRDEWTERNEKTQKEKKQSKTRILLLDYTVLK